MRKVAIVTDSASDLPLDLCKKYHIHVVPAYLNFETESYPDDGVAITRQEFYERLATAETLPTTAAPPVGVGEQVFRKALEEAEHVVAVAVGSHLSGIHDGMLLAARSVSEKRITVMDSQTLSMGEGWMAVAAAEAADNGASVDEVKAAVEEVRSRTIVYAALDTLEYLRRSGRVGWARAGISAILDIKPIIAAFHKEVNSIARVRTTDRATQKIVQLTREQAPIERLAIMHSNARARAEQALDLLKDVAPPETIIVDVTPVVGTNVGPGGLGVGFVRAAV